MGRQLIIHRRSIFRRCWQWAGLCGPLLVAGASAAWADKLTHSDGTVVEGTIKSENPDQVQITTRHGDFTFDKGDLVKIERTSRKQATPAAAPTIDNSKHIPAGPINPFSPPQIPPLVRMIPTAATTSAGTTGTATTPPAARSSAPVQTPAMAVPSPSPSPAISPSIR